MTPPSHNDDLYTQLHKILSTASLPGSVRIDMGAIKIAVDMAGALLTDNDNVDCTLSVTPETIKGIAQGDIDPMNAYFSGDLTITGDMGVAMALANVLKS